MTPDTLYLYFSDDVGGSMKFQDITHYLCSMLPGNINKFSTQHDVILSNENAGRFAEMLGYVITILSIRKLVFVLGLKGDYKHTQHVECYETLLAKHILTLILRISTLRVIPA